MKIGILGTGFMGKNLTRKLAAAGHEVKVANSRGPETIAPDVLETGAQAATAEEALKEAEVVILAMPHTGFDKIRPLVAALPEHVVVIDISNYFPGRDGVNPELEAGKVESEWVRDYFGRPVTKAWNNIGMVSFETRGKPKGDPDRIALPVAGDRKQDRDVALKLVEDTGFDAFDAGSLADSWRQQPGSPVYCTDLHYDEIPAALAEADISRLPKRRDLAVAVFQERAGDSVTNPNADFGVQVSRIIFR